MNTDTRVEMFKQLPVLSQSVLENFNVPDPSLDFPLAHQHPEFPAADAQNNLFVTFHPDMVPSAPTVYAVESNERVLSEIKKKRMEQSTSSTQSISPATSTANTERKNSRRGKKGKSVEKVLDKVEEVVHIRAKRGLATDSHSTAERVRREKINDKFRCLRDIVPGCNKQMGMAVMLEEIINYVLSLENQVQFLSMELAAASCHPYHLHTEAKPPEKIQETNSPEAQDMQDTERLFSSRYGEVPYLHPSWSI